MNGMAEGIVSAIRDAGTMHIIQTTASCSPGSSVGPLLNDYGKVIGLTTSTVLNGQSINFVVSARHVSELLNRKQPMSLEEMLAQTQVTDQLPASTISVPPRNAKLPLKPSWQQQASRRIFARSSPNGRRGEPFPYSPVPKSSPSGTRLYCRGGHFLGQVRRSARGRPKAVFLLLACCTQEEDAICPQPFQVGMPGPDLGFDDGNLRAAVGY